MADDLSRRLARKNANVDTVLDLLKLQAPNLMGVAGGEQPPAGRPTPGPGGYFGPSAAEDPRGPAAGMELVDILANVVPLGGAAALARRVGKEAFVNIGLKVGEAGAITAKEAVDALRKQGVKIVGDYTVHQSATEPTLVVKLARPLTDKEGHAVSRALQQESIAQYIPGGEGKLLGPKAADWGPFNPEFFLTPGGKPLSQSPLWSDAQLAAAKASARSAAGKHQPLEGLPQEPLNVGGSPYIPGPYGAGRDIAADYMRAAGLPYTPPTKYTKVDPERASRIAKAFDEMPHAPNDPRVRESYDAMVDETIAQFKALQKAGVKFEFIKPGMDDPYKATPRLAQKDVIDNKHLWVFPTEGGFGSGGETAAAAMKDNPLLRPTGIEIDGHKLVANDVFRIVHDFFGHIKEGHGFRAGGEENAWLSHAAMYSDKARPAMTTETRGQNSWVNYGPHGEKNRNASAGDTVYADQKIGLLPDWVMDEGRVAPKAPVAAPAVRGGDPALFDYSKLDDFAPNVPQFDLPRMQAARGLPDYVTAKDNPETIARLNAYVEKGIKMGGLGWHNLWPLRERFIAELGEEKGVAMFNKAMDYHAATSNQAKMPENIRIGSYYHYLDANDLPLPQRELVEKVNKSGKVQKNWTVAPGQIPEGYGHYAQATHLGNAERVRSGVGLDTMKTPKPPSFGWNLKGNMQPVAMDMHESRKFQLTDTKGNPIDSPPKQHYGFYEGIEQREAGKKGIMPGQYQASGWLGGGDDTNLMSGTDPALRLWENAIKASAARNNLSPEEVLRRYIRGAMPLGIGGFGIAAPGLLSADGGGGQM